MRQIVTGTGRSGTGYIAAVINAAGLDCGHERHFTPHGPAAAQLGSWQADSSWMAVPYLHEYPSAHRVLVWREPEAVIASFLARGFFSFPSPWLTFWEEHSLGALNLATPFDKACAHYVRWHERALQHCDVVTPLDDINWPALMGSAYDAQCINSAVARVPTNVNDSTGLNPAPPLPLLPDAVLVMRSLLCANSA